MIRLGGRLRLSRFWLSVIPLCALLAVGCRARGPEDHLRLLSTESSVISATTSLELSAEDLPTGRPMQVMLRGKLSAAGKDPRQVEVSLVGHVLAPERLSVVIDPDALAGWGRGTFEGQVVVRCEASAPRACVGVLTGARFDVELQGELEARQLRFAVDRLLPDLGLAISDDASTDEGLVVAEVVPEGLAARGGLRVGDTIVRSNGVTLHGLGDLAPGPNAQALWLAVQRASGEQADVRVALAEGAPLGDSRLLGACLVMCPLIALVLMRKGWLAPDALMAGSLVRVAQLRRSSDWVFGFGLVWSLALGAYSALWASDIDPFVVLLAQLAGWLVLRGTRTEGLGGFVVDELGLGVGVLSVAAVSGTRSWHILLREQGAAPWAWNGLARLPLSLALVLCVVSAARLHAAARQEADSGLARLLWDRVLCAVTATLCAGLFFGGAYLPQDASTGTLVLGVLVAAAKSGACYGLLAFLEPGALARSRTSLWVMLGALTALWMAIAPSRGFDLVWGSAACVFAAVVVLLAVLSLRAGAYAAALAQVESAAPAPVSKPKAAPAKASSGKPAVRVPGPAAATVQAAASVKAAQRGAAGPKVAPPEIIVGGVSARSSAPKAAPPEIIVGGVSARSASAPKVAPPEIIVGGVSARSAAAKVAPQAATRRTAAAQAVPPKIIVPEATPRRAAAAQPSAPKTNSLMAAMSKLKLPELSVPKVPPIFARFEASAPRVAKARSKPRVAGSRSTGPRRTRGKG